MIGSMSLARLLPLALLAALFACGVDQTVANSEAGNTTDPSSGAGTDTASAGSETASSTSASSESDSQGETGSPSTECEGIDQDDGSPSGFELCANGATYRVSAETCTSPKPPGLGFPCNEMYGTCSTDDDCVDEPYGACQGYGDVVFMCECAYGCASDNDCEPGKACQCRPLDGGTVCVTAECRTDADCPGELRCGWSPPFPPVDLRRPAGKLYCRTPEDTCGGDEDCGEEQRCRFDGEIWACS